MLHTEKAGLGDQLLDHCAPKHRLHRLEYILLHSIADKHCSGFWRI